MMFSSTTASTEEEARESEAEEVDECSREQPPQLIAVTVEGDLYVFDFRNAPSSSLSSPSSTIHSVTVSEQHASQPNIKDNKNLPSPSPAQQPPPWKLAPSQTLSVEPNVMAALVVDVDGDGHQELLLGRMDGVVQAFGWRLRPLPPSPGGAEQDGEEEKEEEEEKNQQNYQYLEPELYKKGTDEAAAAARHLRSEEAQKLVKAWIELYVESTTDDEGTETKEGTSAKNKRINVDKGPPTGAVPTKGK
eukprot:evm.model.NODE_36211_length_6401_cov_41.443054.2